MPRARVFALVSLTAVLLAALPPAEAGDWPMARYDAGRSAASPDDLPAELSLHWVRALPSLKPAWPDQAKMRFDVAYEPVAADGRLFIGSSHNDSLTAYDTATGRELWKFFAQGPIRFAPVLWNQKVYFAADDGYLYCLQAGDGSLVWKFRGGPSDRKLLGNERMISVWPARGAPVIDDGQLYFAAGIWPFMGVFLHALDAESGDVLWTNDGDGSIYIKQPHNSDSFAGVAPQGNLVATGSKLLIPGGRSVPACYDRETGKLLYYELSVNGKRGGGSAVAASDELFFNGGVAFSVENGQYLGRVGELVTFADGRLFDFRDGDLHVLDISGQTLEVKETTDRKGEPAKSVKWAAKELARVDAPKLTALIKAGSRLYAGGEGRVLAYALPLPAEGEPKVAWEATVDGTVMNLAAADDKLFATTLEGRIYCFGDAKQAPSEPHRHAPRADVAKENADWQKKAATLLEAAKIDGGYCLAWGVGSGQLVTQLASQSNLKFVVVEPDTARADAFRRTIHQRGWPAERVSVLVADPHAVALPAYFASLIVAEELPSDQSPAQREKWLATTFHSLRPYGGAAYLPIPAQNRPAYEKIVHKQKLSQVTWNDADRWAVLRREGAIPDTANWTHEHADAANTRVSRDKVVKAPLGLLWFGGASNEAILPRHGHGPQPQVVDGRLFIEGVDLLRATDIYTGRVLWETSLPGVGEFYNNTAHQPGANASGTNYIATADGIYVAYQNGCVRLDPATGKQTAQFQLPAAAGSKSPPAWGYVNVADDYLIGGADPLFDPEAAKSRSDNDNNSSSSRLVVMNRHSGEVLWSTTARSGFRHNAICIGHGRLYAIDRLSGPQVSRLKRRGEEPRYPSRLTAFDLATGKELWSTERDVFGTWLSYSAERDILVEAGRQARDTLSDEPKGMRTYQAATGEMVWENESYRGPAMIHHDTILMAGDACDLLTGAKRMREHPLSGEPVEWSWSRNYGCNTPAASEHLLTFRSGAAGYFDFCTDGGTGNFGGFRSSCTNNLIVAGGLLNAPDYTRTCTCSYQNQTSLALIHMPEVETWTSFGKQTPKQRLRDVGVNLGAPGDRKDDEGTLWLEYPDVGGASPELEITTKSQSPEWFRRHSSQVSGAGLNWVAASGATGLTSLRLKVAEKNDEPRRYIVRLHFLEPDDVAPGERTFAIQLQGRPALAMLDVVAEAGGQNRSLVKEFTGVEIGSHLELELIPTSTAQRQAPILSGVELHAEGW